MSAAGRHDDKALEWKMKVEAREAIGLGVPGNVWLTPGRSIAAALTRISHGEFDRALTLTSNACLDMGRSARGRALLQIVLNHYSSGKNAELMYYINHIQKITLKG